LDSIYHESNQILYNKLRKFFNNHNIGEFIGVSCPFLGPQCLEECDIEGSSAFCGMWSIWFTDLKLSYPDIDSYELLYEAMTHLDNIGYTKFIYGYSKFILNFARMLKYENKQLLKKIKKNVLSELINNIITDMLIYEYDVIDDETTIKIIDDNIHIMNRDKVYYILFNYILTNELYKLRIPKSYIYSKKYS